MILSKFRQSKLWRNKWKVLFSTVTLAALVIFTSYKLYNYQAKQNFYQAIQEWETKGETTDLNQLLPTPPAADKDFFQHPAFIAEHNKSFDYSINAPHKAKIPGFSPRYSDYNHQSNHRMGVSSDITYWLDSNAPQQPERGRRRRANRRPSSPTPNKTTPNKTTPKLTQKETAEACLKLLRQFDQRIISLREASQRPHAYYPLSFDEDDFPVNPLAHYGTLSGIAQFLNYRSTLYLFNENPIAAADDAAQILTLYQYENNAPSLVGFLTSIAILKTYQQSVWHGLRSQSWDDATLKKIETALSSIDERKRLLHNLRQEICYSVFIGKKILNNPEYVDEILLQFNSLLDNITTPFSEDSPWQKKWEELLLKSIPHGFLINQSTWGIEQQSHILFYPDGIKSKRITLQQAQELKTAIAPIWLPQVKGISRIFARQVERALQAQADIHNMRTAIALERYRLKHLHYPESLNLLIPDYLPRVLEDVITDKPLHYRIKDDGTPLIYSIGANQTDDGGKPHRKPDRGDWAWMYSPPKDFTYQDYRKSP